jgi:hypothetical protein
MVRGKRGDEAGVDGLAVRESKEKRRSRRLSRKTTKKMV